MLLFSETLQHGKGAGMRVAFAPLFSDLPIVTVAILILSRLPNSDVVLGSISLLGAAFLVYLAYRGWKVEPHSNALNAAPRSLAKAVLTNLLNPNPYLFWGTVGAPLILRTWRVYPLIAVAFVVVFYVFMLGADAVLVLVVERARDFLRSKWYVYVIRGLSIALLLIAVRFTFDAARFWSIW